MRFVPIVLYVSSVLPLAMALRANLRTTLVHALVWTIAAWLAWLPVLLPGSGWDSDEVRYVALCLTCCAGIAVLGARRPVAGAWNAVLASLLAVLLLPLAENAIHRTALLDPLRLAFLAGTLTVGMLNYLPTRMGPAALAAALAGSLELAALAGWIGRHPDFEPAGILVPLAAWVGMIGMFAGRRAADPVNAMWFSFRDRYGLFWGQRTREQFNLAARHAKWPLRLTWQGVRRERGTDGLASPDRAVMLELLQSILKRFARPSD
jgi:hypothetical protein